MQLKQSGVDHHRNRPLLRAPPLLPASSWLSHTARALRRRHEGGDRVDANVVHEQAGPVRVDVRDNNNGTYTMSFVVAAEGTWTMRTKVCRQH